MPVLKDDKEALCLAAHLKDSERVLNVSIGRSVPSTVSRVPEFFFSAIKPELLRKKGKQGQAISFSERQHFFVIPNDGMWHHVAVTWENMNGSYEIFVDGQSCATGNGLIAGSTIESSGIVVVGNDKDGSGFESRDAFVGSISRLNVWDHVLPRDMIALLSRRCGQEVGEILSWNGVKVGEFYGEVYVREPSSCQIYV